MTMMESLKICSDHKTAKQQPRTQKQIKPRQIYFYCTFQQVLSALHHKYIMQNQLLKN